MSGNTITGIFLDFFEGDVSTNKTLNLIKADYDVLFQWNHLAYTLTRKLTCRCHSCICQLLQRALNIQKVVNNLKNSLDIKYRSAKQGNERCTKTICCSMRASCYRNPQPVGHSKHCKGKISIEPYIYL